MITTQAKNHQSYVILDNESSYSHNDNKNDLQHYSSESSSSRHLQSQESNSNADSRKIKRETRKEEPSSPFFKRILIVDDDPDITLTFKIGLEDDKSFEVYTYTDSLEALSNFKPHFYDLLLADINMPKMNGFELCSKILERGRTMESCRSSRSRKKQELKEEEEEREQGYFVTVSDGMNAYRIYQLYLHWFIGRMRELRMKAKDILEQIMHCIRVKRPVEERDRLIEKRDSILESLVLLCARYYIPVCVKQKHYSLSYLDMLIFCNMIIVFDYYWLPYVKFWEIMERVGYKIMDEKG
jgi:CheY-like chemotaxis protein